MEGFGMSPRVREMWDAWLDSVFTKVTLNLTARAFILITFPAQMLSPLRLQLDFLTPHCWLKLSCLPRTTGLDHNCLLDTVSNASHVPDSPSPPVL